MSARQKKKTVTQIELVVKLMDGLYAFLAVPDTGIVNLRKCLSVSCFASMF